MRLINADELIKKLEEMANDKWNIQVGSSKGLEDAIDVVENAPTIIPDKDEFINARHACLADIDEWKKKDESPQGEWIT